MVLLSGNSAFATAMLWVAVTVSAETGLVVTEGVGLAAGAFGARDVFAVVEAPQADVSSATHAAAAPAHRHSHQPCCSHGPRPCNDLGGSRRRCSSCPKVAPATSDLSSWCECRQSAPHPWVRRVERPGPAHDDQNTMDSTMLRAPTPIRIQLLVWRSRAPPVGLTLTAKASIAPIASKKMPAPSSYDRYLRMASDLSLRP
jgi:hypothetical protein